jgi:hypothetical protein|tara:strand:+ start:320 stop:754 length:435 start_codon:yes stop_codon:yes gene_type:complete
MAEEDDLMQLAEIADLLEDIEELEELEEEEETNISLPEEYGTEQFDDEELHFAKSMVLLQRKIDGAGMFGKKVSVEPGVRDVIDQMLNSPAGILAKEQLSLKGIPPLEMPDDAEIDQMLEEDNGPTAKGVPMGDQKFTTMDKKD